MSGGTPRKFSEKIAIMERKQHEDVSTFEDIMREVRSITTTNDPVGIPVQGGLHPPAWPQLGGSLPNVAQLPSYSQGPGGWQQWEPQHHPTHRSRSPESHQQHFHPYRGGQRSPDRVPPLHPHYVYPPQHTLQPPDHWNQMNRARSDPAIHQIQPMHPMHPMHMQQHQYNMQQHYMQLQGGSGMHPGMQQQQVMNHQQMNQMGGQMQPMSMNNQQQQPMSAMNTSPLQSPMGHMLHGYQYPNGSPMQSPLGSPMGSSMMLDDRTTTPMMELSPPGMSDPNMEGGSLPNLQQMPPQCYHATVGQRNYSNSPEAMDIPKLILTNPEGAHGPHVECYNDIQMQLLTLDSNEVAQMANGSEGIQ